MVLLFFDLLRRSWYMCVCVCISCLVLLLWFEPYTHILSFVLCDIKGLTYLCSAKEL